MEESLVQATGLEYDNKKTRKTEKIVSSRNKLLIATTIIY